MNISVITCTYNRKEYLQQTIESVQKSILAPDTDIHWEHLIYDDASTDGTENIFTQHTWPNVTYFVSKENKGPSYGRNFLMEKAKGEYIFMIDDDDIVLQRTLYNFVQLTKVSPYCDWFIADFLHVDAQLRYVPGQDYFGWNFTTIKQMLSAILKGEHFLQSNVFFKKTLFKEVGGFDPSLHMSEDLDLFFRFLLNGHMPIVAPIISHLHRLHDHNLSATIDMNKHKQEVKKLSRRYQQTLSKMNIGLS